VSDGKGSVAEPRLFENVFCLGLCDLSIEFLEETSVRSGWETRLFVQKRKNAQLALYDINARLIVRKFDKLPMNLLLDIFLLFEFEDVCIKLQSLLGDALVKYKVSTDFLLQLLIRVVDAELFKGILKGHVTKLTHCTQNI